MNQRTLLGRLLSPAGFGLVLILFLTPFITVSCGTDADTIETTFKGIDLVVGSPPTITGPGVDADLEQELADTLVDEVDLEPLALLAAFAVLAGMAVALLRRGRLRYGLGAGLSLLAGLLIVGSVLRVRGRIDDLTTQLNEGGTLTDPMATDIHTRFGFWLALITLVALAAGNGVALLRAGPEPAPSPDSELPEEGEDEDDYRPVDELGYDDPVEYGESIEELDAQQPADEVDVEAYPEAANDAERLR